jgi:hypothetical protein
VKSFAAQLRMQRVEQAALSKALPAAQPPGLVSLPTDSGWIDITPAQPPGYFQLDIKFRPEAVLAFPSVFACVSLISNDIGCARG